MSLYMAIVVYAPALALAQVTGFNVYLSVSLICFVCMFYTTLGGMKAVLWTDALQVSHPHQTLMRQKWDKIILRSFTVYELFILHVCS